MLNHVLLHQTIIGIEAKEQLALAGETRPDVVVASCGGGSNLGGIALPFLEDTDVRLVAVEPSSCPTLTEGRFEYDFGDTAGMTPLMAMYTLGHDFVPPSIHAGGLRYHGDSPIISTLVKAGRMEAIAYPQGKTFEAAVQFANTEGKVPAPETGHTIRAVIDEARSRRRSWGRSASSSSTTRATGSSISPPTTTTSTAASTPEDVEAPFSRRPPVGPLVTTASARSQRALAVLRLRSSRPHRTSPRQIRAIRPTISRTWLS